MTDEHTRLTDPVYRSLSIDRRDTLRNGNSQEKRSRWFLYLSAIVVNLLSFTVASGFSWTSSALQKISSDDMSVNPLGKPATPTQESWVASLYPLGAAVGPLIAGKLCDTLGRKRTMLAIAVPKLICLIAVCFASDIRIYYAARFIMGMVLGTTFAILPLYLAEISEIHNRGTISSIFSVALNCGIVYCLLIGPLCSLKLLTLLCTVPLIIFIFIFGLFIPESPVFLVSVGKHKEALKVLQRLRNTTDVKEELQEITKSLELHLAEKKGVWDLFRDKQLRKALIIVVGLVNALQIAGINPIVAFLEGIFRASGSNMSVYLTTNLTGVLQVIGTVITVLIAEKFGRKTLLIFSSVGVLISHIILTIYFFLNQMHYNVENISWLPVASLFFYMLMFNLGISAMPFAVMGEVFIHSVKASGASIATFTSFLTSFVITLAFRIVFSQYGLSYCFSGLTVFIILVLLFVYFVVPETKGKSEAEIQQLLKK
ncbi:facilitated trehalose transporter Tret1-like [Diabrotica undecimpunctata]|uniref:facilitated trehalose transporter Tret1-like n=1 Tax=Diabrotica undecimpunctata TaxID=50387 RepID=UPI003B636A93